MAYSEDHIALAAEYALGTLDAEERVQVQTMMAVDASYAAVCEAWEFRLGALNQMVGLVEPRAEVWERIKAAIARPAVAPAGPAAAPQAATLDTAEATAPALASELPAPEAQASAPAAEPPGEPVTAMPRRAEPASTRDPDVIQLAARVRQWRTVANAMTALAAALLAMITVQVYRPDLLPAALQSKPRTQVADAKAPPAQFVALLQKNGEAPAFILTVDAASKSFTVRRVGAEPEQGKSYELWLVSDRLQAPRSLGVIGNADFTTKPALSSYDSDTVNSATFAVSLEPEGGSPTGAVTGPIVFSGKLIETVPPAGAR
ncbi:anti-sigma factor domain-containing protein [Bradyrhizobium sp. STM 3557]|uniref:anti-sigma factor n=1 Tax=Bradyrhizobium sp. STM 3557 TaxID=578920 RepID=UPI00389064ED